MSEQFDLIALHRAVVANEYEGTDETQEALNGILVKCSTHHGKDKTDRMVAAGKLYASKHPNLSLPEWGD